MVAEALNEWLPKVIQAIEPFYSAEMEKGAQWSALLDTALEGTSFGIVCLTPENLDSRWIHYETGALSKLPGARVWTFLLGMRPGGVEQPLGKFQATVAEKVDVLHMMKAINQQLPNPLSPALLHDAFEIRWPQLEAALSEAAAYKASSSRKPVRDTTAMLDELLTLVRAQERRTEERETLAGELSVVMLNRPRAGVDLFKRLIRHSDGISGVDSARWVGNDNWELPIHSTLEDRSLANILHRLSSAAGVSLGHVNHSTDSV